MDINTNTGSPVSDVHLRIAELEARVDQADARLSALKLRYANWSPPRNKKKMKTLILGPDMAIKISERSTEKLRKKAPGLSIEKVSAKLSKIKGGANLA